MLQYEYSFLSPGHIRMLCLKPHHDNTVLIECHYKSGTVGQPRIDLFNRAL
jgi:hypothetical protein